MKDTERPEQIFGRRARYWRQARGWSQEEVAEQMKSRGFNWRQTTVAKTEGGDRPIRLDEAVALAHMYSSPLSEMIEEDTRPVIQAAERALSIQIQLQRTVSQLHALQEEQQRLHERVARSQSELAKAEAEWKEATRAQDDDGWTRRDEEDLIRSRTALWEEYLRLGGVQSGGTFEWRERPPTVGDGDDGEHSEEA